MKLLLVDGLNLVRRIYAATFANLEKRAADGTENQQIAEACAKSLSKSLAKHRPTHCVCVFETRQITWRHELLPEYKKDRKPMPTALANAMDSIRAAFLDLGVQSLQMDGFEADDVIATLAKKAAAHGGHSVILSTDRLHCQLLATDTAESAITIYDHFNNRPLDADFCHRKFPVQPQQIADLMGLVGDARLGIPGVKTIGIKTASSLINRFGKLEDIFDHRAELPPAIGGKLETHRKDALLARTLFTLKTDISLGVNLQQFRFNQ